ncbi:hypothetical protein K438DRAFT_1773016 [Mycena galopus ATCC 62051]|nr:hypothetical protein K438DRAFT_1773016 [Mycena galopus ATCC 62051]
MHAEKEIEPNRKVTRQTDARTLAPHPYCRCPTRSSGARAVRAGASGPARCMASLPAGIGIVISVGSSSRSGAHAHALGTAIEFVFVFGFGPGWGIGRKIELRHHRKLRNLEPCRRDAAPRALASRASIYSSVWLAIGAEGWIGKERRCECRFPRVREPVRQHSGAIQNACHLRALLFLPQHLFTKSWLVPEGNDIYYVAFPYWLEGRDTDELPLNPLDALFLRLRVQIGMFYSAVTTSTCLSPAPLHFCSNISTLVNSPFARV